jgi:hypothetical protein
MCFPQDSQLWKINENLQCYFVADQLFNASRDQCASLQWQVIEQVKDFKFFFSYNLKLIIKMYLP